MHRHLLPPPSDGEVRHRTVFAEKSTGETYIFSFTEPHALDMIQVLLDHVNNPELTFNLTDALKVAKEVRRPFQ